MEHAQLFRKILFPTDFSEAAEHSLSFAAQLSQVNDAELYVLFAYRLINEEHDDVVYSKKQMENKAQEEFKKVDALLQKTGLRYTFLTEIGFLSDRILSNIKLHDIDLLVLPDSIKNKTEEKSEKGLMKRIPCPVMLVPRQMSQKVG